MDTQAQEQASAAPAPTANIQAQSGEFAVATSIASPVVADHQNSSLPFDFDAIQAQLYGGAQPTTAPAVTQQQPAVTQPQAPAEIVTQPAQQAGVQPQQPQEGTTQVQPEAQATPAEQPNPDADEEGDNLFLPDRIRTKRLDPTFQRMLAIQIEMERQGTPISAEDALARAKSAFTAPVQTPAQPAAQVDPLADIRTQLADVDKQLKDAGANEGLVNAEIIELFQKRTDLAADLKIAERDQKRAETEAKVQAQTQHKTAHDQSFAKAVSEYPSAGAPGSPLDLAVNAIANELSNPSHPNHAIMQAATAPEIIVQMAVHQLAASMATKGTPYEQAIASLRGKPAAATPAQAPAAQPAQPAQAAPQAPATPERRVVSPASGTMGTPTPAAAPNPADILRNVGFDPQKAEQAIYGSGSTHGFIIHG